MLKSFTMSRYSTLEELYKAKAEHYQKCYEYLAERMVETEDLRYCKENCAYYEPHSGEFIEDIISE